MNFLDQYSESEVIETQKKPMKKLLLSLGVLLLLGSAGSAAYFYKQYDTLKKNPSKVTQDETKALIEKVGQLIVLPAGEQPTVATVTDPSKLKDQAFFANAQSGDKVLVFTQAKKAILYSPADNKIVEVAPVNLGSSNTPQAQVSGSSTDTTNPTK